MAKTEVAKTDQKSDQQKLTALQMIEEKLKNAPSLKAALSMPLVQDRFIADYKATTGRDDGQARFASEVLAYMELVAEKPELANADRWQHFAAIVKVGRTGLSLRGGQHLYVYPGKNNTIKVEQTPAGRRVQMERMPDIKRMPEAQLVMSGDVFVHDKLNSIITKHESNNTKDVAQDLSNVVAAYQRIYWKNGTIEDIVVYKQDLVKARLKSPAQSEASFWATFPGEACKKVATKRAHRLYHKYPDSVLMLPGEGREEEEETQDTDHTVVGNDVVEKNSGEVVGQAPPAPEQPAQEAKVVDQPKGQKNFFDAEQ